MVRGRDFYTEDRIQSGALTVKAVSIDPTVYIQQYMDI